MNNLNEKEIAKEVFIDITEEDLNTSKFSIDIDDIELFRICYDLFFEDKLEIRIYENKFTKELKILNEFDDNDEILEIDENEDEWFFIGQYSYWVMDKEEKDRYSEYSFIQKRNIDYIIEFQEF